ncbi:hypothetical protein QE406_000031 [Microbacterium testaceum]|nr:hypothetical protein [Microbacterium testaceum]
MHRSRCRAGLAERALPHERHGHSRAVVGGCPDAGLPVVGGVEAAEDRLSLAQEQLAGRDDVVVHGAGGHERAVAQAQDGRCPLGVAAGPDAVERLIERDLVDRSVGVREQAEAGETVAPVGDDTPVAEGVDTEQALAHAMRDHDLARSLGIGCRDPDQLEIESSVVVEDVQHVFAVDDRVVDRVLDALAPRPDDAGFAAQVVSIDQAILRGDRRSDADDEIPVAAREVGADPVPLVGFVEQLHVGIHRRADLVQPDGVGTPRVVDGGVDDEASIGGERRPRERAGDLVGERLARDQVAHTHGVPFVAGDVDAVEHARAVVRDLEAAEREEVGALGLDVAVEEDLLAGDGFVGRELRRGPVVGRGQGSAALDAVLGTGHRASVVPPVAATNGDGQVGLERASLDLAEDLVAEGCQVRGARVGVGVLGLEVRHDLGVVLRAQPFVGIVERVTMVRAGDGTTGGDGRNGRNVDIGHPFTVVGRTDTPPGRSPAGKNLRMPRPRAARFDRRGRR